MNGKTNISNFLVSSTPLMLVVKTSFYFRLSRDRKINEGINFEQFLVKICFE